MLPHSDQTDYLRSSDPIPDDYRIQDTKMPGLSPSLLDGGTDTQALGVTAYTRMDG